ncbi:MAG: CheR family methyltransferase [Armatimonadota bacterium]
MNLEAPLVSWLRQEVRSRAGLCLREKDNARLGEVVRSRARAVGEDDARSYLQNLRGRPAEPEWTRLVAALTNGESFFFRDAGQWQLLTRQILPELVRSRRSERRLRCWSAGCSTGEEPFTLALVLSERFPELEGWELTLIGTDVNPYALETARRGVYSPRSLRSLPERWRRRFQPAGDGKWELDPAVRQRVTFRQANLLDPGGAPPELARGSLDLILCRNVLIYFDREGVAQAGARFSETLRDGGYLVTGHAELHGVALPGLDSEIYEESVVYRRRPFRGPEAEPGSAPAAGSGAPAPAAPPAAPPAAEPEAVERLRRARRELEARRYASAVASVRQLLDEDADLSNTGARREALGLAAQCSANLGDYPAAERLCRALLELEPLSVKAHYLLAQIAEAQADREGAKTLLQRVLYLEPSFVPASLDLASLYETESDPDRARKLRLSALECLRALPPERPIPELDGVSAGLLADQVARELERSE